MVKRVKEVEEFEEIDEELDEEEKKFEACLKKNPGNFNQAPYSKIPISIHRNVVWQKWRGTARASTVWFLFGYIIRAKMNNRIADTIYKEYFIKRKLLAARFSQQGLAELLGYASKKGINNQLMKCEKEGVFKVEWLKVPWRKKKLKIYVFGSWENKTGNDHVETIDMFTKFKKEDADRKLQKKFIK